MTSTPAIAERETDQMVVMHLIFRRGFAQLANAAHRLDPGERGRVDAFICSYAVSFATAASMGGRGAHR